MLGEEEEWCLAWVTWGRGTVVREERIMEQQVMVVRGSHIRNSQSPLQVADHLRQAPTHHPHQTVHL